MNDTIGQPEAGVTSLRKVFRPIASGRWQFTIRNMLGINFVLSVLFGGLLLTPSVVFFFSVPAACLGYRRIVRGTMWTAADRSKSLRAQVLLACFLLVSISCGLALLAAKHGVPSGPTTWLTLVGLAAWSLLAASALNGTPAIALGAAPCIVVAFWYGGVAPLSNEVLLDLATGRRAVRCPPNVVFEKVGKNAGLIESYLGSPACSSPDGSWDQWRSSQASVSVCSLANDDHYDLRDVLQVLPDDELRKMAIRCLTDEHNQLREFQALLLVALKRLGYPNGCAADTWWASRQDFLAVQHERESAAETIAGWLLEIQWALHRCDSNDRIAVGDIAYDARLRQQIAFVQSTASQRLNEKVRRLVAVTPMRKENGLGYFSRGFEARVTAIHDGDSITVTDAEGVASVIHLEGVDCPERHQPYHQNATAFTHEFTLDKLVRVVVTDITDDDNFFGVVWVGNQSLGMELARAGLAWSTFQPYHDFQNQAVRLRVGLWGQPDAKQPWLWRDEHAALAGE